MDYKKANLNGFDVEELACKVTGMDYDEIDADTETIEDALLVNFELDIEQFTELVNRLIPLIDVGESPITKKKYKGFSNQQGTWLAKIEVQQPKT
ncbi:MAG: hypothetical protein QM503_10605 [Bacteroidota bacterium]